MIETLQLQLLLATFAAWANRKQAGIIAYLIEENRVLKEQLDANGKRVRLTDGQRRRLAVKGKPLGRRILREIATIVSPDTILAWHRKLIAAKWTYATGKIGRRGIMKEIRELIAQMAEENPSWGYARIQGALKHLDHRVSRSTIAKVLKEQGTAPAPERPMSWRTFIRTHAHLIAAADFFTTEVWTPRVAGTTTNPTAAWMTQIARNLTDCVDGFLTGKRYLILDRDALFAPAFLATLKDANVSVLRTAYRAPNMNAFAERFVRSIKSECLDRMIFVGLPSLEQAIREFVEHYHAERPHQGLGNDLIRGAPRSDGDVAVKERLGGLLRYYYRDAA